MKELRMVNGEVVDGGERTFIVVHTHRNPPETGEWEVTRTLTQATTASEAMAHAENHCKHDTASEWGRVHAVYPQDMEDA